MLARYTIIRGKRPADQPLPEGIRQDTRKHTKHCLRPPRDAVDAYLANPSDEAWQIFTDAYLAELEKRHAADPQPFDAMANLATQDDLYIGCSCPTKKNPSVWHCHTVLALQFMAEKYPDASIEFPPK